VYEAHGNRVAVARSSISFFLAENPRVAGSIPALGTTKTSNGAGFSNSRRFRLYH
jgi:hypothetical protein